MCCSGVKRINCDGFLHADADEADSYIGEKEEAMLCIKEVKE